MKIVRTASGKKTLKLSKKEWTNIGKKAGWMKKLAQDTNEIDEINVESRADLLSYATQLAEVTYDTVDTNEVQGVVDKAIKDHTNNEGAVDWEAASSQVYNAYT